jgi:hypothetical protein
MLASLTTCLVWSLTPPIAELSSPALPRPGNPTTLQLALIAIGTLSAFTILKRARDSRRERRRYEIAREALAAVTAQAPAPHFAERATPVFAESAEDAA